MKRPPSISDAEWKILKLLWHKAPQSAYDLHQHLQETEQWHRNTLNTLLKRLEQKGAVKAKLYKNLHLYRPLFSEPEMVEQASENFLDRVFGGAVQSLLIHFARKSKLNRHEIQELKRILEEGSE